MIERIGLYKELAPFQGNKELIKRYQDTEDIIKQILSKHKVYAPEYDKISNRFWAGSAEATARNLFDFCKANIKYKIEPEKRQSIMSPSAILYKGAGDCKHYASFINGVLDSLRRRGRDIDCYYRFASYRFFDPTPQHVFAVVRVGDKEIFVDPVLSTFNNRKKYFFKQDKATPMALYSISGTGDVPIEYIGYADVINDGIGRTKRPKKGGILKKAKQRFLKVSLFASRNSFLLLVKLNTFHLATKMYAAMKKGGANKIKTAWEKVGGNWKKLETAIKQGVNTYNKLHKKKKISGPFTYYYGCSYHPQTGEPIGAVQFAAAAAIIAAAMPIIAKLMSMLKGVGVSESEMHSQGGAAAAAVAEQVQDQQQGKTEKIDKVINAIKSTGMVATAAAAAFSKNPDGSETVTLTTPDVQDENTEVNGQNLALTTNQKPGVPAKKDQFNDFFVKAKTWVVEHKTPLMITGAVVVAGIFILPRIMPQRRGYRRR